MRSLAEKRGRCRVASFCSALPTEQEVEETTVMRMASQIMAAASAGADGGERLGQSAGSERVAAAVGGGEQTLRGAACGLRRAIPCYSLIWS